MFEFHGWATIRDTAGCDDVEDDPSTGTIDAIRTLADGAAGTNRAVEVRWANGQLHLWIAGCHNRRREEVLDLFTAVAVRAPGSYGILHMHDDEDPTSPDSWTRYVMRRGSIRAEIDASLSPHVGLVEDDCSEIVPRQADG